MTNTFDQATAARSYQTAAVTNETATRCPARGDQNISRGEQIASVAGGIGLALFGLAREKPSGWLWTAIGASLAYRGYSGHCYAYQSLGIDTSDKLQVSGVPAKHGVRVEKSIVINQSPEHLYAFWHDFENLPQIFEHLENIESLGVGKTRWTIRGALGSELHADIEIINKRPDTLIAWQSLPGGDFQTAGSIHFRPLNHQRGTGVNVELKYNPPAGKLLSKLASQVGMGIEQHLEAGLRNFKVLMETGDIVHT